MTDPCAAYLVGTRVLSRGRFRLDRERALHKLAHYALATPAAYVLELVAAGVRAGGQPLQIRCDSDDLVIWWDGGLVPHPNELARLLDWLFDRGTDDRSRMLQHLAQGIHTARGLRPKWIRLGLPELHREPPQPSDTAGSDTSHPQLNLDLTALQNLPRALAVRNPPPGFSVHIRRPLTTDVARAFFRNSVRKQLPRELLEIIAHTHGVAIDYVDQDRDLVANQVAETLVTPPTRALVVRRAGRELWLDLSQHRSQGRVVLIRDGIRVGELAVGSGGLGLFGHVRCDTLNLDASRAQVIDDNQFRQLAAELHTELGKLIARRLRALSEHHRQRPPLRRALLLLLHDHQEVAAGLHHTPALRDSAGRVFSLAALARSERILRFRRETLAHRDIPEPHFVAREALPEWIRGNTGHDEVLQWRLLERHFAHAIVDADDELAARAVGRSRREYRTTVLRALHAAVPGNLYLRDFEVQTSDNSDSERTGGLARGLVSLIYGRTIEDTCMRVELFVDELPCETVDIAYPGPVLARVSSPGLRADDNFESVLHDHAYEETLALVRAQADAMVLEIAAALAPLALNPDHQSQRLLDYLYNWLHHQQLPSPRTAKGMYDWLPPPVRKLELFARLVRTDRAERLVTVSLSDLLLSAQPHPGAPVRCVAKKIGYELVPDGVVVASPEQIKLLAHLLQELFVDITQMVLDERTATRRRAAAWATPMLTAPAFAHVKFRQHGLYGELALALEPTHDDANIALIHAGVELGSFRVPLGIPGLLGSVAWEQAVPNRAFDGLEHPEVACSTLAELLERHLAAVLERALVRLRGLGQWTPLPSWVPGLLARTRAVPCEFAQFPVWTDLAGQTWTTHDLVCLYKQNRTGFWTFSQAPEIDAYAAPSTTVGLLEQLVPSGSDSVTQLLLATIRAHLAQVGGSVTEVLLWCDGRRAQLLAHLFAEARIEQADHVLDNLVAAWHRWMGKRTDREELTLGRFATARVDISAPGLDGQVALPLDEVTSQREAAAHLRIDVFLFERRLETIDVPSCIPLRAVIRGPEVIPNVDLTALASGQLRQRVVDIVRAAVPDVFAALCFHDDTNNEVGSVAISRHLAAPRRVLLAALLRPQNELGLTREKREQLVARLVRQPIFRTLSGEFFAGDRLAIRALRGEAAVVAVELATAPDPGGVVTVVDDEALTRLVASGRLPALPDRSDEVAAHAAGSVRPLAPLDPTTGEDCPEVVAHGLWTVGSTRIWAALLPSTAATGQLEYMVEHRVLPAQPLNLHTPIWIRTTDLDLVADPSWSAPVDNLARQRVDAVVRRVHHALVLELAYALADGVDEPIGSDGEPRTDDSEADQALSTPRSPLAHAQRVVVCEPQATLAHLVRWGHHDLPGLALLRMFARPNGPCVSLQTLRSWAHHGPLWLTSPGVHGEVPGQPRVITGNTLLGAALGALVVHNFNVDAWFSHMGNQTQTDAAVLSATLPSGSHGWLLATRHGADGVFDQLGNKVHLQDFCVPLTGVLATDAKLTAADWQSIETELCEQLVQVDDGAPDLAFEVLCRLAESGREIPRGLARMEVFCDHTGRRFRWSDLLGWSTIRWVTPGPHVDQLVERTIVVAPTVVRRLAGLPWVAGPLPLHPRVRHAMPEDLQVRLEDPEKTERGEGVVVAATWTDFGQPGQLWFERDGLCFRTEVFEPGLRVGVRLNRNGGSPHWMSLEQTQVVRAAIEKCLAEVVIQGRTSQAWRDQVLAGLQRSDSGRLFYRDLKVFLGPNSRMYSVEEVAAKPLWLLCDELEARALKPHSERPPLLRDEVSNRHLLASCDLLTRCEQLVDWENRQIETVKPDLDSLVCERLQGLLPWGRPPSRSRVLRALQSVYVAHPKLHATALDSPQGPATWLLAWLAGWSLTDARQVHLLCLQIAARLEHRSESSGPRGTSRHRDAT